MAAIAEDRRGSIDARLGSADARLPPSGGGAGERGDMGLGPTCMTRHMTDYVRRSVGGRWWLVEPVLRAGHLCNG